MPFQLVDEKPVAITVTGAKGSSPPIDATNVRPTRGCVDAARLGVVALPAQLWPKVDDSGPNIHVSVTPWNDWLSPPCNTVRWRSES